MIVDTTSWIEDLERENRPSKREQLRTAINRYAFDHNIEFGVAWCQFYQMYERKTGCILPRKKKLDFIEGRGDLDLALERIEQL
jgi:hypothetical protein